ncbi:SPARC-related modular calcium-binding protein 1 isoform X1 [Nasonia vitripennis]|uniref:SPARC-related modular calcium-binding protein 2 n=1 Tax=Nasonia vitripennis TaxID=7425 RepID=A0A7M7HD20_NASVI|nr:SPARC-related modular calcium-binding protein 1 isoform X1 [Nasonia vitripennis]
MELLLLLVPLLLGNVAADPAADAAREDCRWKLNACTTDASANVPVCGSDGLTYPNQCRVISKQCLGESILVKHTGPCSETPPCLSARVTARPGARIVCRPDGTYAPVQCHPQTSYCWCVTPQGRPIPNSTVREGRPRCARAGAAAAAAVAGNGSGAGTGPGETTRSRANGQRSRSSQNWKQRRQYSNRHRNTCDRVDKARFNGNLIENFKIEYRRINGSAEENAAEKNAERVLSWKFGSLDKDGDGYLDRDEYKELRRLAKKAVRPKKCARTFARTCDLNQDLRLSRAEWGACLANDFTLLQGNPSPVHARPTFNDDPPDANDDTDANDCISDRRSVMEDQRQNSDRKFYIPECTPDGRYHKVQCYSGYCWCVYQDTGKPIPGTSSKDLTPNCNPVPVPDRPMKGEFDIYPRDQFIEFDDKSCLPARPGCPEPKKQQFLRDLMDLMQKKMKASSTDSDEATDKWQASKEERVATWHFVMLDKNKNKFLERKEWKSFRTMVANNPQLRRCGKKLPRYCDINNDREISMTEWLSCLNAQRPATADSSMEKASTLKPKRMGPNPLDQFLNDDD